MAPLDKTALLAKLDTINAVSLGKTPIADSLAQVGRNLVEAKGRRWVILLIDGEETCDGHPAAVLQEALQIRFRVIDRRDELVAAGLTEIFDGIN